MAMIRILMVVGLLFLVACGDDAGSGSGGDAESDAAGDARCEGESLLVNYQECVGDEAYWDEWGDLQIDAANRNSDHVDPGPGEANSYTCGTDTGVAHFCNYDPDADAGECMWQVWPSTIIGSRPVLG